VASHNSDLYVSRAENTLDQRENVRFSPVDDRLGDPVVTRQALEFIVLLSRGKRPPGQRSPAPSLARPANRRRIERAHTHSNSPFTTSESSGGSPPIALMILFRETSEDQSRAQGKLKIILY
jgi:hypothetical protein